LTSKNVLYIKLTNYSWNIQLWMKNELFTNNSRILSLCSVHQPLALPCDVVLTATENPKSSYGSLVQSRPHASTWQENKYGHMMIWIPFVFVLRNIIPFQDKPCEDNSSTWQESKYGHMYHSFRSYTRVTWIICIL
jgi:hypothetical protein